MNIKTLDDVDLLSKTKALVAQEKEITLEVLTLLREIETRKLFLARGFPSLFEFCVEELGYSEGAANRRISSMRLIRQLPEVEEKMRENKVNLSTLSLLHSHIRREEKSTNTRISKEEKIDLLRQIEGKSQDGCQRELLKHSTQPVRFEDKERAISCDLTEIKFTASKPLLDKFKKLKGRLAHRNPNPSWSELFEILADMGLAKLSSGLKGETIKEANAFTAAAAKRCVNKKAFGTNFRYIPQVLKKKIWVRDNGKCQFVDPLTRRKCESSHAIQIDHIMPFALGGEATETNLRLLCRAHNAFRAEEVFGPPPMGTTLAFPEKLRAT